MRDIMKTLSFDVDGEEKSFRLIKMNAFDGSYLMKFVTEKALPLLQEALLTVENEPAQKKGAKKKAPDTDEVSLQKIGAMLPKLLESLTSEELKKMMIMCLQTCEMSMPAGYQRVVDQRGNFGIEELEYDTAACLRLTYEVIVYNCSGFFEGSGLISLLASRSGSRQKP